MKSLLTFGLAMLCAAPALAAKDNFNRADLGNKWKVVNGTLTISNDQMQGSDTSIGSFKKSSADTSGKITVILNGTLTQYGAVALGDIKHGNNAFVKIQNNAVGSDKFDTIFFYDKNNGNGPSFPLTTAVPSGAILEVSLCGPVATAVVKGAGKPQTYTYNYAESFPTGVGLGLYGGVSLDNFSSSQVTCGFHPDAIAVKDAHLKDSTHTK